MVVLVLMDLFSFFSFVFHWVDKQPFLFRIVVYQLQLVQQILSYHFLSLSKEQKRWDPIIFLILISLVLDRKTNGSSTIESSYLPFLGAFFREFAKIGVLVWIRFSMFIATFLNEKCICTHSTFGFRYFFCLWCRKHLMCLVKRNLLLNLLRMIAD